MIELGSMSALGRQPPVVVLSRDRPLLGESRHWESGDGF